MLDLPSWMYLGVCCGTEDLTCGTDDIRVQEN